MVLIVVGVMIWQFSTTFQRAEAPMAFSTFLEHVEKGQVRSVTITGNEIAGELNTSLNGEGGAKFRTYAPTQY
jgi:ATP-dependent Zn protease